MKESSHRLFEDFSKAVLNLESGLADVKDELDKDGSIKRFELCYELAWKLLKAYLENTGIICKNPRDCFKAAKENSLISNELSWLQMIEDRNYLVHCYSLEESRRIFDNIQTLHFPSLLELREKIKLLLSAI